MVNCRGSAVHLSKVLMNALHNAMEAMPAGGQVLVGTTMARLGETHSGYESIPPGEYVVLSVEDNGVGIAAADLGRIFEPFYTKKSLDRSGTGLGMTVIWTTVKDHRGYLDIVSREGLGTTLRIYLPATHDMPDDRDSRRIVLEDYLGTETILVVDDSEDQRTITATILEKLGYTVLTAMSGEAALALIATHPVELVILDMVMPGGMDGLETYREMVTLRPGLRAIIVSGFSETDRVRQAMALGVRRFIQKPYSMEQLWLAIRQVLDRPAGGAASS
jgi:CheY-like chemotaxis protein